MPEGIVQIAYLVVYKCWDQHDIAIEGAYLLQFTSRVGYLR